MSRWLLLLLVVLLYFATAASGAAPRDRDRDRLPDRWEKRYGLSISKKSARRDPDHDGLRNLREFRLRTNPRSKDTDGDGLRDGAEVRRYHTNPRRKDTDGDGYSDRVEVLAGTNPRKGDKHPSGSPPPSTPAPGSRPTGSNCMDDPSACGFPDVDNTGPSNPSALMTVNGNVTLSTPGQVYENRLVNGQIIVTAANVTIRNVKIMCRCAPGPIRARPAEGSTNLLVEDVEIDQNGNLFNFGIDGAGYTLRRVKIHNGSDCGATGADTVVEDTFCSLGPDTTATAGRTTDVLRTVRAPIAPHWDGFQTFAGSNFRLITTRSATRASGRAPFRSVRTSVACPMCWSATT